MTLRGNPTPDAIAAQAPTRVIRMDDGGAHFTDVTPPDLLYLAGTGGVRKSRDGGETWFDVVSGLDPYSVGGLQVSRQTPGIVYARTCADDRPTGGLTAIPRRAMDRSIGRPPTASDRNEGAALSTKSAAVLAIATARRALPDAGVRESASPCDGA